MNAGNRGARVVLLADTRDRRASLFLAALRDAGVAHHALDHRALVADTLEDELRTLERTFGDEPLLLRLDAIAGGNGVEQTLRRWGHADAAREGRELVDDARAARAAPTELLAPAQRQRGVERYLARLEHAVARRPQWRWQRSPAAVARLFDKRACWALHRERGLRVPDALPDTPPSYDGLIERLRERGWRSAFVKLSSGSSASGLAVVDASRGVVMTTPHEAEGRRHNSLRLRRLRGAPARAAIEYLLREGAHVERAIAKARLGGRHADLRVLCVEGEPAFGVARTSTHPITNLHLGGQRGDIGAFRAQVGPQAWARTLSLARRVAAAYAEERPGEHLGLDLAIDRSGQPFVLEANAFGDLLPGAAADGVSVYAWQADRLGARALPPRFRDLA